MRSPRNDGGREQGAQSGDHSDPDCENEDVVHERFVSKQGRLRDLFHETDLGLLDFGRIVRSPIVFDGFQPLNLARAPIDPVTVYHWTGFRVSSAFGVMIFPEDKLKLAYL